MEVLESGSKLKIVSEAAAYPARLPAQQTGERTYSNEKATKWQKALVRLCQIKLHHCSVELVYGASW